MLKEAIAKLFEALTLHSSRKTKENLENSNQNSWSPSRDLNSGTHEYVEGMLPCRQLRSILRVFKFCAVQTAYVGRTGTFANFIYVLCHVQALPILSLRVIDFCRLEPVILLGKHRVRYYSAGPRCCSLFSQ